MATPPNQLPIATPPAMSAEEIRSFVQNILSNGNVNQQVQTLMTDNFDLREKNRVLRGENEVLKAKVPAEGSRVLNGEEAKTYEAFVALNLKPADITKLQQDHTALQGKVTAAERKGSIAQAAKVEGYDETVLGTLVGDHELSIASINEEVNGQTKAVDRAFIGIKGTDGAITKTRLNEYIEKNHAKFIPSLTTVEGGESRETGNGTKFPRQTASAKSGKPAEATAAKNYIKKRYGSKQPADAGK
jgi:hypothetical protein